MDQIAEVRERTDIVALISEYVPVKKAGRNFKMNCPFHNEKTPSLVISPDRQIWRCFGCGKGGDVFTFLMMYERLEFGEALRLLAKKAGIELVKNAVAAGVASKKETLYEINHTAAEFYHYLLTEHVIGKNALQYVLKERHILPQTVKTFKLGYAPSRDALFPYLTKKKGYSLEDIKEAGLISLYYNKPRDFFHDRLMFPLYDHRDNIVGFSGRVLTPHVEPKYINTSETLIYHKGQVFFGLNIAKEPIKKADQVIIMEGEFDLISSFQEGITNVVAVKGTALTEDQVNLIARFAQKITLCFDMDAAGQEAVKRSLSVIEKKGLRTTVIIVPNGKDADEAIKEHAAGFKKAVKHDIDIYEFLLEETIKKHDKTTSEGKKSIGSILLPIFSHIQNEIVKEHYLTKLSREIHVSTEALQREIDRLNKLRIIQQDKPEVTRMQKPSDEEYLVAFLIQNTNVKELLNEIQEFLSLYQCKVPAYQHIIDHLLTYTETHEIFNPKLFLQTLPAELVPTANDCYLLPIDAFVDHTKYGEEVRNLTKKMKRAFIDEQMKIIGEQLDEYEKTGNADKIKELQEKQMQYVLLLKKK